MRTLWLSAQDGAGGAQSIVAATAAPGPMIEGPATVRWMGAAVLIVILLSAMFVLIRVRVTLPGRRKRAEARQYFEPADEDEATAFDAPAPARAPFDQDAPAVPVADAPYAPPAEDYGEAERLERWDARERDEQIQTAEPVEEDAAQRETGEFFGGGAENEKPAQPAQNDNEAKRLAEEYPDADYEDVPASPQPEEDRSAPKIDEAFVQALSSEFAAYRKSTRESIDMLSRRMDALAGASPDSLASLAQEIASLKAFLADKPAAVSTAGRIQLSELVRSVLPARQYAFSQTLSTGRTADCLIHSPDLGAPFAIDARFPVDAFDHYCRERDDFSAGEQASNDYRRAVLRHVVDIAENLIVRGETADFAIMFVPAEPIYHDLYASFGDVVQDSYRAKVWILSPTTLMASLHMMSAISAGGKGPDRAAPANNPSGALGARKKAAAPDKPGGIHDANWPQSDSDARVAASLQRLQEEQAAREKEEAKRKQKASSAGPSFPLRSQRD